MLQKTDERRSIRRKCDLLHINRSSLYYEPKELNEAYLALQEELMKRIDYWHTKHPYLGSRKLVVKLGSSPFGMGRRKGTNVPCIHAVFY